MKRFITRSELTKARQLLASLSENTIDITADHLLDQKVNILFDRFDLKVSGREGPGHCFIYGCGKCS